MVQSAQQVSSFLGFSLPADTPAQQARLAAVAAGLTGQATPTSLVSYNSSGRVLIVGPLASALAAAEMLAGQVSCFILATQGGAGAPRPKGGLEKREVLGQQVPVIHSEARSIEGYLGNFVVTVRQGEREVDLAQAMGLAGERLDIVLDLGRQVLLQCEVQPPGYFAPRGDSAALAQALEAIPELTGQFEKPRYVIYNPAICAHGERGISGCRHCLDACPADALATTGERITVEAHLCQGMGVCASVCPTGALAYAYPGRADTLDALRRAIAAARETAALTPALLLFDGEHGAPLLAGHLAQLPDDAIPWKTEAAGTTGLEVWLAALAYGARSVTLLLTEQTPVSVSDAMQSQVLLARAILEGLGLDGTAITLAGIESLWLTPGIGKNNAEALRPATFGGVEDKRAVLRFAIDHIAAERKVAVAPIELPRGAPFGEVRVDGQRCTLCMGCVSVCPTGAMLDNKDRPQLSFIEWHCVQCGLCEQACPEQAITREPRLLLDDDARMRQRVLHEEVPFECVECGKAFTTVSMVEKMEQKLATHRMFQGEGLRRLRLCEDCRVKVMFDE